MGLSVKSISTGLGIKTSYYGFKFGDIGKSAKKAVAELNDRHALPGQFLKWVSLPERQLQRVDNIYKTAEQLKNQTQARFLSVIGIGGSKHPIEHMLSINGLNLDKQIKFMSDIDTISHNRFMTSIGNDVRNSNYLVVSKSGTTFEPKDALIRTENQLRKAYMNDGYDSKTVEELTKKHFVAVTDAGSKSELRMTSTNKKWLGELFIHDDVGGRFSAFDDHTLFALAYAGMKKTDMVAMLQGASDMSQLALKKDLRLNDPLAQAAFWVQARLKGIQTSVHQYLGSMFEDTVNWHSQMQNESIKNTLKQIAKVPDAMHHSAEAHFNPANKFAFALTSPKDTGTLGQNLNGYIGALNKTYAEVGPHFNEVVETNGLGLTPQAAGALTQSRAFSTVYQELIYLLQTKEKFPDVLESVLQPFVERYKINLRATAGKTPPVLPGRTTQG